MKPKTLSLVKNLMRRSLKDLLEGVPSPAEQRRIREHFKHCCAYCGAAAAPREGHIDHADPDGGNGIGNLLLACKTCNGDRKRETPWQQFLEREYGKDSALYEQRQQHIAAWMNANPSRAKTPVLAATPAVAAALDEAEQAIAAFAKAYDAVRRAIVATAIQSKTR